MASTPTASHGNAFGHPGIAPTGPPAPRTESSRPIPPRAGYGSRWRWAFITEIYYPTIDRPQIRDAQFLVTDGETFFQEEKRDMTHETVRLEKHTLGHRVL